MAVTEPAGGGIIGNLRRMTHSLGALVHTRFELFVVELQEEKLRTLSLLAWTAAGIALGTAGLLVAIGALALYFWEKAGYAGLAGLAAITLGGSAGVFMFVRHRIRSGPAPFAATAAEFQKDMAC